MKLIHTSDWHIGQTLRNFDREDEHRHFFSRLAEIMAEEKPDALLVSGDVYHTSLPVIASQYLLVETLMRLHHASPDTEIVVIAGNHDSGSRLEIHSPLWADHKIHIVGRPGSGTSVIPLPGEKGTIVAVPYISRVQMSVGDDDLSPDQRCHALMQSLLDQARELPGPIAMMAHMAISTEAETDRIGGLDSKPLSSVPSGYDYLALGHIHMPLAPAENAMYCGSPFQMNFDENHPHYVNVVEISHRGAQPKVRKIEIFPLRSFITIEADSAEEALAQLSSLPADADSYIRMVVHTDDLLPADIDDRARLELKDKCYRYCGSQRKQKSVADALQSEAPQFEIEDFLRISPLEIARQYFEDMQVPDAPIFLDMILQIIENTTKADNENS